MIGCQLSVINSFAQKAGDIISGTVTDNMGPVMMANVVEIDAANRIVASAVTDMSGNFSFKLKNPKDKLRVSFVGYKTVTLPLNKTHFAIKMQDATQIREVTVTSKKRAQGSGLAIPVDEISTARQSIDMKEFEGLAITTVDEALQGRIAGLDIVANSGNLGSGTSMRLRGVSSINGSSEPLIVVDGNVWETNVNNFDFNSANEEKFAELLNVNPEDIESISVLKDAAATAIWGSQGSNGVIEIKTKRGARGKTRVNYSFRLTGTYQPQGYKLLNGDEYTMMLKEEYFNPSMSDADSNIPELNYTPSFSEYQMYNNNTDWVKAVKQTGWRQNHYVAISGGGEKANFRIGAGYDHETGSIIKQQLDRFTSRVNLDYFVSDRIKIETNIALTYTKNKHNGDPLGIALVRMPNLSIYEQDKDGNDLNEFYTMLPTVSSQLRDRLSNKNPIALSYLRKDHETSYNIEPEFKLRYNLLSLEEEKTRLQYEGKVVFNIFNRYEEVRRQALGNHRCRECSIGHSSCRCRQMFHHWGEYRSFARPDADRCRCQHGPAEDDRTQQPLGGTHGCDRLNAILIIVFLLAGIALSTIRIHLSVLDNDQVTHARQLDYQRNILISLGQSDAGSKHQPVTLGLVKDDAFQNAHLAIIIRDILNKVGLCKLAAEKDRTILTRYRHLENVVYKPLSYLVLHNG